MDPASTDISTKSYWLQSQDALKEVCFSSCLQCQKVQTIFRKEILNQAKLAVASSSSMLTLITQLTTMLHTHFRAPLHTLKLVLLWYTASCPPLLSSCVCPLFHGNKKMGKAVIKSYCYKTSLNTDITWRIRVNINACPHPAMELCPIKCHHIFDTRMLPWQSITKI